MDRVDTRSGNKEGVAPEMVESNPTPTNPNKLSQPAPPPASSPRSKGKAAAAAVSSSRRGPNTQTEGGEDTISKDPLLLVTQEEEDAVWAKLGRKHFPTYLAGLAGEPAQLAIEYYKNKEGVQLQLTEMINGRDPLTDLGFITHLQFKASSCGEPSDAPPKTVYAQIHTTGPWPPIVDKPPCNFQKAHASRVFTHESPLLKDARFQVDPTNGWIDYPYDCPECGFDFLNGRDGFKGLRRWDTRI